jgi:hypothetical protein
MLYVDVQAGTMGSHMVLTPNPDISVWLNVLWGQGNGRNYTYGVTVVSFSLTLVVVLFPGKDSNWNHSWPYPQPVQLQCILDSTAMAGDMDLLKILSTYSQGQGSSKNWDIPSLLFLVIDTCHGWG